MMIGLGDTIASVADIIKAAIPVKMDCGCEKRKQLLNEIFPYIWVRRKFIVLEEFIIRKETFVKDQILEIGIDNILHYRVQRLVETNKIKEIWHN